MIRVRAMVRTGWLVAGLLGLPAFVHAEPSAPARLVEQSLLTAVTTGDGVLVAVGERGHVLRSTDGAVTWTQSPNPAARLLTTVINAPGGRLWTAGHDAVLLSSDDQGKTWSLRFSAPEEEAPILALWFETANHGIAVGAYGLFLETRDGGGTWEQRDVHEEGPHWYGLALDDGGSLFLAGEFGILLRSDDAGGTWTELPSPYEGTFFGVLPVDGAVLVYGLRGHLFRSEDDGERWIELPTGTDAGLLRGRRAAGGAALVGLSGAVLLSRDGGRSFTPYDRADRRGLSDVLPLSDGTLLLLGEGGFQRLEVTAP